MELEKLKGLLGIPLEDTSQDVALQFAADDAVETIINYCNVKELPSGLIHTAYRMAVDIYRMEKPGTAEKLTIVTSIKTGDTSTSFAEASETSAQALLRDYKCQLNRYRKLKR